MAVLPSLTPSEDSVKTEEEKKDESEVKQEEKKEETAKADSSNKSNTSESKKDNTASTTNTSSNKNNTSSSKPSNSGSNNSSSSKPSNNSGSSSNNSKPAEHTHNWVAVTETRTVVDQPAYDEQIPQYQDVERMICNQCGADISGNAVAHNDQHLSNYEPGGYHLEVRQMLIGYQTVHHDAVTHTETVTTGYRCSTCGATK